jgi:integrase
VEIFPIDRAAIALGKFDPAPRVFICKAHLLPRLGGLRLDAITRNDLKPYVYDLLRGGKAPATVRRIFAVLRIILNEAEDDELLARHPMRTLRLGQLLKGAIGARAAEGDALDSADGDAVRCLTPDELRGLLDAARAAWSFDQYALLLVLARTGVRIGEAVGLQWGDLDLDARMVVIRRTCRGERTSTPKSGKGRACTSPRSSARRSASSTGSALSSRSTTSGAGASGSMANRFR